MTRKRTSRSREPRSRQPKAEPVAIAWYLPEQWGRLRQLSVDRDALEETHAEWLSAAETTVATLTAAGTSVVKVVVDPSALESWCRGSGRAIDGAARAGFVAERFRELASAVDALFAAGDKLPAAVERRILELGAPVIPLLLDVVNDHRLLMTNARGRGYAPVHAINLLGQLAAVAAVEPLLRLMEATDWQDIAHDACLLALPKLGAAIVEPALHAYDRSTDPVYRDSLCGVLAEAGVRDERIYALLLESLQLDPVAGAGQLAEYGDPRAIPHLADLFDRHPVVDDDSPYANHVFIELQAAITDLGGSLRPIQQAKLERVKKTSEIGRRRIDAGQGEAEEPRGEERRRKPGRNEPCWCGSGKKYKTCHLAADEAG